MRREFGHRLTSGPLAVASVRVARSPLARWAQRRIWGEARASRGSASSSLRGRESISRLEPLGAGRFWSTTCSRRAFPGPRRSFVYASQPGVERKRCFLSACKSTDRDRTCPVCTRCRSFSTAGISGRQSERRRQDHSGGRQLTRSWKPLALRCAHEGWHIFAFLHLGQKASTHFRSTRRRPTGGLWRQSGWGSCGACSLGRFRLPAAETSGRKALRLWRRWSSWRRPTRRLVAVEEQQALISEKLLDRAKQSVQTEPHLHVGCQEIGQEKLFVVVETSPANRRERQVEASVPWTAPSHAWSMRCGWYFLPHGTRLLKALAAGGGPYGVRRC